jgi:hypothetical protein
MAMDFLSNELSLPADRYLEDIDPPLDSTMIAGKTPSCVNSLSKRDFPLILSFLNNSL